MHAQSRKRKGLGGLLAAPLLAIVLLSGCAAPETSMSSISLRPYSASNTPYPTATRRIPLMNSPMDIRNDYIYPMTFMRQKLAWTDGESLWHMTFPTRRYAYAGIELRHRIDVSAGREATRLTFRIRPARMAPFLSVALVDQPTNSNGRAMTDFWLHEAGTFEGDGWATVEIVLTNFPSEALPVADGLQLEPDPMAVQRRPFDWTSVREIRFVSGGGRIPSHEVVVKNLRFQR